MKSEDVRWKQRFDNFKKALRQLENAVKLARERKLSDLEEQGLIQAFEFTHELAWNTLKDFLVEKGNEEIYGSKDATRKAFKYNLIENGDVWMNMIISRNKTSHTYNEEIATEIVDEIINNYYSEFEKLSSKFAELANEE
ncbi:MAG: nucleotidyltransferase [Chlorobi bacterium]|nr:nucleotidyltransferase [Chlorobiota bacterium]